jgi:glycosyltransferase involved in cell wall biosynthesis
MPWPLAYLLPLPYPKSHGSQVTRRPLLAGAVSAMRVLLLNYEYPPLGSGAGLATRALAEGLAARGVSVDVVSGGDQASSDPRLLWDGAAAEEGLLTVHRVASHRLAAHDAGIRGAVGYLAAATPTVRRLLGGEPYDVVHFVFSLPTAAMLPLLDLHGAPVIVTLRGSDVPGYDERRRGLRQAHRLLHPLTRWIWRRADRVVVPSESLGRLAQRTDARLRYSVVPGGVDLGSFRPRPALRRLPDGVVRCLAVARLVERNGLDDLLDALALLERGRYQLEIVGTGPHEAALRERVRRLGLESSVRFTGWLEPREVARRCREADLFTLAPWVESLGAAFVEALASGLPIVGSTAGGIPELVEHGRHGMLVAPRRPRELAHAISYLGADPVLRATIGRRNRADAERTYAWDRMTARHVTLYHGVQRRAPSHRPLAELPSGSW